MMLFTKHLWRCLILVLTGMWPCMTVAQSFTYDQRSIDSIILVVQTDQDMDSGTKSDLMDSVFQIAVQHQDLCLQVHARIRQSTHLDNMGMSDSALVQLYWANRYYRSPCDSNVLMMLLGNLTNVFLSLGEFARVDSVSQVALRLWNLQWNVREPRYQVLNNLAIAKASIGDSLSSIGFFRQAYKEASAADNEEYIQKSLLNLGTIKGMYGDLDSASYFLTLAAHNAKAGKDIYQYMTLLVNLANVEMERQRYSRAAALLDSAYTLAEERKYTEMLASTQHARSALFARMNKYKEAHGFLEAYLVYRDQYLNEQRVKAVTEMMEKYESEKKARQIQQLELDKLDAALENEKITNARNRYLYTGAGVLVIALGLWSRLRYVRKSRAAIQKEKDVSEGLLLNILPAVVAEELKAKGFSDARHFQTTTILFSDFKGFTTISEIMNATELVEEINTCFKAFDEITTRYSVEKIKTIGDSYMAAGGINDTASGVKEVVMAGLDMQDFILARKKERDAGQLPAFEMRVGIHSGPVVAGIVGVKKFQYDLWGDTVNTASRMESHGTPGHVNVSEETYRLLKDDPALVFTPRGKLHVKGKGEMTMYYVSRV